MRHSVENYNYKNYTIKTNLYKCRCLWMCLFLNIEQKSWIKRGHWNLTSNIKILHIPPHGLMVNYLCFHCWIMSHKHAANNQIHVEIDCCNFCWNSEVLKIIKKGLYDLLRFSFLSNNRIKFSKFFRLFVFSSVCYTKLRNVEML